MTSPKEIWICPRCKKSVELHGKYAIEDDMVFCEKCGHVHYDPKDRYLSSTHARSPEHLKTLSEDELSKAGYERMKPSLEERKEAIAKHDFSMGIPTGGLNGCACGGNGEIPRLGGTPIPCPNCSKKIG
jgi:DNA-directed RNA polymerase subunit RPC12/RpoP